MNSSSGGRTPFLRATNLAASHLSYPGGLAAEWTFDNADRETSLAISGDGIVSPLTLASGAAYKPFGPLTGLTLGNGLSESRLFDQRSFPDRITVSTVPTPLDWDYTIDAVGNPTLIADGGTPRLFAYQDFQYFLTQGDGPWGARGFSYDKIGNRLSHSRTAEPTATYAYAGSGHNPKLSTVTPAPGWGTGNWSYSYDAAGNQTEIAESNDEGLQQTTFYDPNDTGQLAALRTDTGPSRTDFLYDARNFLREAHLTVTGSPDDFIVVTPTYSSDGVLMAKQEEREWTGSGIGPDGEDQTIVAASDQTTEVLYFAGRPIALRTEEEILYLSTDHLATPILATDGSGVTVWLGGLEPFGAPWSAGVDNPDPESGASSASSGGRRGLVRRAEALSQLPADKVFLRYPGQWSSETFRVTGAQQEIHYNLHRWLDRSTGRYARPDPFAAINTAFAAVRAGINPFTYVRSQPTVAIDRLGLAETTDDQLNCIFNPIDCVQVRGCRSEAEQATARRYPGGLAALTHHNNEADAFRHCYWSCCMAQKIGSDQAHQWGTGHENFGGNPRCEMLQDLANNQLGLGNTFWGPGQPCEQHCLSAPLVRETIGPCCEAGGYRPLSE